MIPRVPYKKTYKIKKSDGGYNHMAIIDCPYCGKEHIHGDEEGHRVAHCNYDFYHEIKKDGYYIYPPEAGAE